MPTDAPHLAKHGALAMAMSPLLWQRFKPDRFDSYSAGEAPNRRPSAAFLDAASFTLHLPA